MSREHFPLFFPPEGLTQEKYLQQLCDEGVVRRYGGQVPRKDVVERLEYELDHLKCGGFTNEVLLNWDIVHLAKSNGIPIGPGLYWQPSSLVAYVLGITDIDPLQYGLISELWSHSERFCPPTIAVDVAYNRRDDLIQVLRRKYGEHSVSPTCVSYSPLSMLPEFARLSGEGLLEPKQHKPQVDTTAVAISVGPLRDITPMTADANGKPVTTHDESDLQILGCLVIDLCPNTTLAVNESVLKSIRTTRGEDIILNALPLDDPKTYHMISNGLIRGVFPIESPQASNACRLIKPSRIQDITALVAIYAAHSSFGKQELKECVAGYAVRNKREVPVSYEHPLLEPILQETYGIMMYQEQYIQAVELLAGFTRGRADMLRRACLRADTEKSREYRRDFVEGCATKSNIPANAANELLKCFNEASRKCFRKSYAVSYGLLAYQAAFFKAHYTTEFYSALLEHHGDTPNFAINIQAEMTFYNKQVNQYTKGSL